MSSILKALKKLEHDKASYRPTELKIDADILRSDLSPRFSAARVLVTSLLLLAGGSGATYLYMKHDKAPESMKQMLSSRENRSASAASNIRTEQLPAAIEVVPAQQQNKRNAETLLDQPANPAGMKHVVATTKPYATDEVVHPTPSAFQPESANTPQLSSPAKGIPALRVNGIACQEEASESVAMINGVPMSLGSVIDGVKIEEIHKDRVEFSYNGDKFEIRLGQSNR